ncbi:transcriptional regulator bolA [Bartonella australis AUST/NH1]|uniref:Transcriptional regulator bolA n=1 Tax=Bartonella australis (strain Aust/NH1) TaxID=1094489 RepID=M1P5H0_BARAA|nr:BolA family protein [Bartonella australis]AGF75090.1 transcriptional regulator bolA [Bartonella australis AUST/NH1]
MSTKIQTAIKIKLNEAFCPQELEVINESHLHAGHHHIRIGHHYENHVFDGRGETHFRVKILSSSFSGMTRVEIHRAIYAVLQQELTAGVHALVLEAKAV